MFTIRNYSSNEEYDIAKFMQFSIDVYDVINCQLLSKLKSLPVTTYYNTSKGYRDIDLISSDVYGVPFLAYYIQFYNDDFRDVFPENYVLKMFSLSDLNNLYHELSASSSE